MAELHPTDSPVDFQEVRLGIMGREELEQNIECLREVLFSLEMMLKYMQERRLDTEERALLKEQQDAVILERYWRNSENLAPASLLPEPGESDEACGNDDRAAGDSVYFESASASEKISILYNNETACWSLKPVLFSHRK